MYPYELKRRKKKSKNLHPNRIVIASEYNFDTTLQKIDALGNLRFDVKVDIHLVEPGYAQFFVSHGWKGSKAALVRASGTLLIHITGGIERDGSGLTTVYYDTNLHFHQGAIVFVAVVLLIALGIDTAFLLQTSNPPIFLAAFGCIAFLLNYQLERKREQAYQLISSAIQDWNELEN